VRRADGLFAGRIYHRERGWSSGIAALPFIAVGLGMLLAVITNLYLNKSYIAKTKAAGEQLPPEERLMLCVIGGVVLPVGLMIFAFTARPDVHWIAPVIAGGLFGFGFVGIFLSMTVRSCHGSAYLVAHGCVAVVSTGYVCLVRCFSTRMYGIRTVTCGCSVSAVYKAAARGDDDSGENPQTPFSQPG
jgi:hypothetical protein